MANKKAILEALKGRKEFLEKILRFKENPLNVVLLCQLQKPGMSDIEFTIGFSYFQEAILSELNSINESIRKFENTTSEKKEEIDTILEKKEEVGTMKYLTLKYTDEQYKINLDKITIIQIKEGYICITFDSRSIAGIHKITEIFENECLNFFEVKKILENL